MLRLDEVKDDGKEIYTFIKDDLSVGSLILDFGFDPTDDVKIWTFTINENFRGHGLSHEMMAEAISIVAARGRKSIWLYVKTGNEPAIKCYMKAGFDIIGADQYTPGSYDMRMIL